MATPTEQIDPHYLKAILEVLVDAEVTGFTCPQFSVSFIGGETEDEEDGDGVEAIGFQAESADEGDEEVDVELHGMHHRAFGGPMPLLNPKQKV